MRTRQLNHQQIVTRIEVRCVRIRLIHTNQQRHLEIMAGIRTNIPPHPPNTQCYRDFIPLVQRAFRATVCCNVVQSFGYPSVRVSNWLHDEVGLRQTFDEIHRMGYLHVRNASKLRQAGEVLLRLWNI